MAFLEDNFNAVASEEKGEKEFGQECKTVAGKAAALMDSLEKNTTFSKITRRPEYCLDNALRAPSDLDPACPPLGGPCPYRAQ